MSWQTLLRRHEQQFVDELVEFCRIPSVSTTPEHAGDVTAAANWVASRMTAAGLEHVEVVPSAGHPVVYGDWLHAGDAPTVLIYGHFDVQPANPIDAWTSPPFQPEVRDGRLYARGASDDKGNMLAPVLTAEAMLAIGALPVNVKFLFEGEEEIGSPNLPPVFQTHVDRFACDIVYSADGGQRSEEQPSLTTAFRGICGLHLIVRGPHSDLHSGIYGGTVNNPALALSEILASMRNSQGKVVVEGFYDDIEPVSEEMQEIVDASPIDNDAYREGLGVPELFREPGYSTRQVSWLRPTLEVDGMWSGALGDGRRAIVPAEAHAKLSCRLVPDQSPEYVLDCLRRHIEDHTPRGVTAEVRTIPISSAAYHMPVGHPGNRVAANVLADLYGREPLIGLSGGTIAILNMFRKYLSAYTVSFAFALGDENQHGPDEFFRLSSFARAQSAYGQLFEALASTSL
ncbi:MAG: dipeptidase [Candidatus Latescibacterota bacterium]|nr:dipeptidase [Candidatus Latescibacterota bacterium]